MVFFYNIQEREDGSMGDLGMRSYWGIIRVMGLYVFASKLRLGCWVGGVVTFSALSTTLILHDTAVITEHAPRRPTIRPGASINWSSQTIVPSSTRSHQSSRKLREHGPLLIPIVSKTRRKQKTRAKRKLASEHWRRCLCVA